MQVRWIFVGLLGIMGIGIYHLSSEEAGKILAILCVSKLVIYSLIISVFKISRDQRICHVVSFDNDIGT